MADPGAGPPPSKTEYVLARLREELDGGIINPGEPLHQSELAARYEVSPTPVREALRRLEAEGRVTYAPHRGATVVGLSPVELDDLYRLRATVEGLATRIAGERHRGEEFAAAQALHEQIARGVQTADGRQLALWNRELHFAIYHLGSGLIAAQVRSLWTFIPPEVTMWSDPEIAVEFVTQHANILGALTRGETDRAAALMSEHVLTAAQRRVARRGDA